MSTDVLDHRKRVRARLDALEAAGGSGWENRKQWFEQVYTSANGDSNEIPWASLKPRAPLVEWLETNKGEGCSALDVGCGLGDNANALHEAGWRTSAFDVAPTAVDWAKKRFPSGEIEFRCADLLSPPQDWIGKFDLVHECFTLQAVGTEMRGKAAVPLKSLVAPGGTLIILARYFGGVGERSGPPWPLTDEEISAYYGDGFKESVRRTYIQHTDDGRQIPHIWLEMKRAS